MGERFNRFAVLVEDGKVKRVAMDEGMDPDPDPDPDPNPSPNPNPDPDPHPHPDPDFDFKVKYVAMDEGMDRLDSTSVDAINKVLDYYTGNQIAPTGFHWAGTF